ncbi:MAG: Ppx/GppA family phosphatase, partial [Balneolaceae bacterium]|nr:Ppx/GppA family phosphatase [Balneolaceae bacterium]
MLVAAKRDKTLDPLHEEQRIPRLGRGVDASGNLSDDAMQRVLTALNEYRYTLADNYPDTASLTVTATSAVRDAANRDYFIDWVREETGLEIQLLSGKEEAEYTFSGALSMIPNIEEAVVIDIGGGSTEIAFGKNNLLEDSHSYDMGSVRFTERYLRNDLPDPDEIIRCRKEIKKVFQTRPFDFNPGRGELNLIGVAGTVTSLAYMDLGLTRYDADRINGYKLSAEAINRWVEKISASSVNPLEEQFP